MLLQTEGEPANETNTAASRGGRPSDSRRVLLMATLLYVVTQTHVTEHGSLPCGTPEVIKDKAAARRRFEELTGEPRVPLSDLYASDGSGAIHYNITSMAQAPPYHMISLYEVKSNDLITEETVEYIRSNPERVSTPRLARATGTSQSYVAQVQNGYKRVPVPT